MREKLLILMVGLLATGCANLKLKWQRIEPGQSRDQVVKVMGPPHSFTKDGEKDILVWNTAKFEKCAVLLSTSDSVEGKACKEDAEAKARYEATQAQAAMMYLQMSGGMRQPAFRPAQPYQAPRPVQANCTTRFSGGTAYSDCSSIPTGIDTSIYR